MVKQLIGSIRIHKKNMLSCFAGFLGFGPFGALVVSIGLWADQTAPSWFCIGAIMALLAMFGFNILNFLSYHQEFMLALSMGQTRKEFMIIYALRQLLWVTVSYGAILLLYQLEQLYYKAAFPHMKQAFALSFLTDWRFVVPFIPGSVLLAMFLGAMYSRFGKKFGVVLYLVWLGSCFLIPRFVNHWDEYTGPFREGIGAFAAWIFAVSPMVWTVIGLLAVLAMAVTIIHLGMKQMVR